MNEQPTNQELMDAIVGIRGEVGGVKAEVMGVKGEVLGLKNDILRLDAKIDAVHRTLKSSIDDLAGSFNAYANETDRRLVRLEAFHA